MSPEEEDSLGQHILQDYKEQLDQAANAQPPDTVRGWRLAIQAYEDY